MLAGLVGDEVGASAITCDLKDSDNKLSFWGFADAATVSEVALAIASTWQRKNRCITAWIEREDLTNAGIQLESSSGKTPVLDLRETHVDAIELDGKRLLVIADSIARAVRSTVQVQQFTVAEVIEILAMGVNTGRLSLEDLNGSLRSDVQAKIAGS